VARNDKLTSGAGRQKSSPEKSSSASHCWTSRRCFKVISAIQCRAPSRGRLIISSLGNGLPPTDACHDVRFGAATTSRRTATVLQSDLWVAKEG
jgi:hypothetical protein